MAKVDEKDVSDVVKQLHEAGQTHVRARKRGALLTVESGPEDDPVPHFRLRRLDGREWGLEFPARGTKWDATPFFDKRSALVDAVINDFGWMLQPIL